MGMYTGLRFKVIVKEKYRDLIQQILCEEDETDSLTNWRHIKGLPGSREWSMESRCDFIPWGELCYMPDTWEAEYNKLGHSTYNKDTGEWRIICSLKNYSGEISKFLNWVLAPIVEDVKYIEVLYEEWDELTEAKWYSLKDLKGGWT